MIHSSFWDVPMKCAHSIDLTARGQARVVHESMFKVRARLFSVLVFVFVTFMSKWARLRFFDRLIERVLWSFLPLCQFLCHYVSCPYSVTVAVISQDVLNNHGCECTRPNIRIFFLKIIITLLGHWLECDKGWRLHKILQRDKNNHNCWYMAKLLS